jgi:hypothetical protein
VSRIDQATEGLSGHQSRLLVWLLDYVEEMEKRRDDLALALLERGIPWKPTLRTDAARAGTSRALARLEQRGLIERIAPCGRTTALKLTVLGRLVALKLKPSS